MANKTTYTVKYRRTREGKTNYKNRLRLLLSGTQRLVIRKSLKAVRVQIVAYTPQGDRVQVFVDSHTLTKYGWLGSYNNIPAAYLTGLLAAKQANAQSIKEAICDLGNCSTVPGSVIFAALAGVVAGGLSIPVNKTVFPKEERITGKHIATYAKDLKTKDEQKYKRQFAQYLKKQFLPEELPNLFLQIKTKIEGAKYD